MLLRLKRYDVQTTLLRQPQGSLWYFPSGQPHTIQATGDDPDGVEFLLVFDNGEFNENDTFLVSVPRDRHIPITYN